MDKSTEMCKTKDEFPALLTFKNSISWKICLQTFAHPREWILRAYISVEIYSFIQHVCLNTDKQERKGPWHHGVGVMW